MVRKVLFWFLGLAFTAFLLLSLTGSGGLWWASTMTAVVVDADTQQPVVGAIVLANWEVKGLEGYPMEQVAIQEVTTDARGGFSLAGWGPEFRANGGYLRLREPTVRVFQRGYLPLVIYGRQGTWLEETLRVLGQRSMTGRDTIALQPAHDSMSRMANDLGTFQRSLSFAYSGRKCEWRRAPRTIVAMHKLKIEWGGENGSEILSVLDSIPPSAACGDPRDVLREYIR